MDIGSTIVGEIVKAVTPILTKFLFKTGQKVSNIEPKLLDHLRWVANWSQQVGFYGMPTPMPTDNATIPLKIDIPRKFFDRKAGTQPINENDLLNDSSHKVLLGGPGAGKTTTMKRLAMKMLFKSSFCEKDLWQYPIVVRLKDLSSEMTIFEVMAMKLGIPYRPESTIRRVIVKDEKGKDVWKDELVSQYFVGDQRLEDVVSRMLSESKALILLDGLDEIPVEWQFKIVRNIEILATSLLGAKIILSCRTGDYSLEKYLSGFDVLEIFPLEKDQIIEIASKWAQDKSGFLSELAGVPYYDLATRPLFLNHLIVLYNAQGYLPEIPKDVYRGFVQLILKDWDIQRRRRRKSRYAHFFPERKQDFLSELSYHLTYKMDLGITVFSEAELINVYNKIHKAFGLSKEDADQVVQEIETHTGLISQCGYKKYEFSHLCLQEFLCGDYLVRLPHSSNLSEYLKLRPAPVAVAVSLSSDPSTWLAGLLLNKRNLYSFKTESLISFLWRLLHEKVSFRPSIDLGYAILLVCFTFPDDSEEPILALLDNPCVKDSVKQALGYYGHIGAQSTGDREYFAKSAGLLLEDKYNVLPPNGFLKRSIVTKTGVLSSKRTRE